MRTTFLVTSMLACTLCDDAPTTIETVARTEPAAAAAAVPRQRRGRARPGGDPFEQLVGGLVSNLGGGGGSVSKVIEIDLGSDIQAQGDEEEREAAELASVVRRRRRGGGLLSLLEALSHRNAPPPRRATPRTFVGGVLLPLVMLCTVSFFLARRFLPDATVELVGRVAAWPPVVRAGHLLGAAREAAVRAAEEQSCPFHPRLNALSEQIMSEGGGEGHDVFARQARHLHNIEEKRQRREEEQQQQQRRLFKPVISDASAILLQARPERLNETPADKTERLAYLDAQRREGVRQQLQQQQAQECTFRPQIDAISARLARSKTRDELSANSRGKAKKAQIAEAIEREALAECTFQPKMHARSGVLAEQVGARAPLRGEAAHELTRRIEVQQAEREARLERCRREAENEKLKECTFQPKIHTKATPETGSPVVVRGLGRYVELKEMAKRQAEAQKQREQKAFLTEPPARLQPYTVPEPFKLSKPRLDERAAARLRELADYEMQECTFAPKTNEVSSTQLLARVMQRAS
eukprot:Transcript_4765.p2 GENE.Transcript_4765~~Transcript_4765.p2  ORF type:complete len:526 (-),score=240.96 Transcript_4765:142-1719(-)